MVPLKFKSYQFNRSPAATGIGEHLILSNYCNVGAVPTIANLKYWISKIPPTGLLILTCIPNSYDTPSAPASSRRAINILLPLLFRIPAVIQASVE